MLRCAARPASMQMTPNASREGPSKIASRRGRPKFPRTATGLPIAASLSAGDCRRPSSLAVCLRDVLPPGLKWMDIRL